MMLLLLIVGLFLAAAIHGMPCCDEEPEFAMVPDADGSWKLVIINEDPQPANFDNPETEIIFTLFTLNNQNGMRISWNDPSWITAGEFNPANPTRVTIHGWNGGPTSRVNTAVRDSLFTVGDFNVIQVDWSSGAGTANYLAARNRVGYTGAVVGKLLEMIATSSNDISVIGHGLGAHVAGFAGKYLKSIEKKLASIVLLDAALPLFDINKPNERADFEDAKYVESIHTNAGQLGFQQPIGHADFYPNGGSKQPGCVLDIAGFCSHARSQALYAESINTTVGFLAKRCSNEELITCNGDLNRLGGEPVTNKGAAGVYYLTTNPKALFARGLGGM